MISSFIPEILAALKVQGSRRGAFGKSVASDTKGPRFESSHSQILYKWLLLGSRDAHGPSRLPKALRSQQTLFLPELEVGTAKARLKPTLP